MNDNFFVRSAKQFATKLSCRIQKTGKLGFGANEHELMNLTDGVYVAFVSNDENVPVTHLIIRREKDEDSFELKKGNTKYPFVETKMLFDFFHFDYVNQTIYLDLVREREFDAMLNGEVYRAIVRINEKNNSNNDSETNDEDVTN